MSDALLPERTRIRAALASGGYPGALKALSAIEAEIDRLRAELAARPEPLGYVAARSHADAVETQAGYTTTTSPIFVRDALNKLARAPVWRLCALVPIPDPEGL